MQVVVVLPFFNAADTIGRAVRSIQDQTYRDWTLVLYDDGSTDGSLENARNLAESDRRIRVITAEHAGIVTALQNACNMIDAPYIARMDADDVSYPTRLEKQLAFMESNPHVGLCGAGVRMTGAGLGYGRQRYESWINSLQTHEEIVRDLFIECPISHPTFFMRRDAYLAAGGYTDNGWAEDYDLIFRLFQRNYHFGKIAEPLLDWSESPKRLSMTDARYSAEQFRNLKRHYLLQTFLNRRKTFYQWGAGEVGKKWLREWAGADVHQPIAVVDINPRKVGRRIHGIPVIGPEALPPPAQTLTVVTVGAPGARQEIRDWMRDRNYSEGADFIFLA